MQLTQTKKFPRTLTNAQIEGFSIHYKNDSGCYKPKTPPPPLQIVANPKKTFPLFTTTFVHSPLECPLPIQNSYILRFCAQKRNWLPQAWKEETKNGSAFRFWKKNCVTTSHPALQKTKVFSTFLQHMLTHAFIWWRSDLSPLIHVLVLLKNLLQTHLVHFWVRLFWAG